MKHKFVYILLICLTILSGCKSNKNIQPKNNTDAVSPQSLDSNDDIVETTADTNDALSSETIDENAIPDAYVNILDKYYDTLKGNKAPDYYDDSLSGLLDITFYDDPAITINNVGYALVDIDNNGIEELFIADTDSQYRGNNTVLNVYTLDNDNAVLLVNGSPQNKFFLLNDNTFYNETYDGYDYLNFRLYKISKNGLSLDPIDSYFIDYYENMQLWGWFHNTTGSFNISDSDWLGSDIDDSMYAKMDELCQNSKTLDLTYFCNYKDENTVTIQPESSQEIVSYDEMTSVYVGNVVIRPNMTVRDVVDAFFTSGFDFTDIVIDKHDTSLTGAFWDMLNTYSTVDNLCSLYVYTEDTVIWFGFGGEYHKPMPYGDMLLYRMKIEDLSKIDVRYMGNLFGNNFDNGALVFNNNKFENPAIMTSEQVCDEIPGQKYLLYKGTDFDRYFVGFSYFDPSSCQIPLYVNPGKPQHSGIVGYNYLESIDFYFRVPDNYYDAFIFDDLLTE